MASFADSPQQYFTPYTPKINTGLYFAGLAQHDREYREGLQTAQNYVSSVAGMEVYRDVDKQYLQNKMGELNTQLKGLAAGDFSNQQLVNQVGALASKIGADKNIQNAVISTQKIKKLMSSQKEMKEKSPDKYGPANEWYDNQQLQSYLANGDVGAQYYGPTEATTYFDWKKPLNDALKELDPTISYSIGATGQFTYTVDKASKVTPAQIQNVVNGVIATDPKMQQQMDIDGLYTYKDYTPSVLLNRINSFYDTSISQLRDLNNAYRSKKGLNPNNLQEAQQYDQFIADNENSIKELEQKRNNYRNMFASGANINDIKRTLFNDQVRNTFITNYQKDNHEIEVKADEEKIKTYEVQMKQLNFAQDQKRLNLDFIKAGINPDTGAAIKEGDPYYEQFRNASAGKSGKKGLTDDLQTTVLTPIGEGENTTGEFTRMSAQGRIAEVDQQLTSASENLRDQFAQISSGVVKGTKEFEDKFSAWAAYQESLIQDGKSEQADPNYLSYRAQAQLPLLKKSALNSLITNVDSEAAKRFPIPNQDILVEGLTINGKKTVLTINPAKQPTAISDVKNIRDEITGEVTKRLNALTKDLGGDIGGAQAQAGQRAANYERVYKEVSDEVLGKYKSSPNYNIYRALVEKKKLQNVLAPVDNLLSQRQAFANDRFKDYGRTWNYQGFVIGGEEEDITTAKQRLLIGLQAEAPGEKIKDLDKYKPIAYFTNNEGQAGMRYVTPAGEVKDVVIPALNNEVGRPDPDRELISIIETSYNKITPTEGPAVLTSENGKVRYAIGKNSIDGSYNLFILSGNNKTVVPRKDATGRNLPYTSPGEIKRTIEQLSYTQNPATGQPLSTSEIIQMIQNPVQTK